MKKLTIIFLIVLCVLPLSAQVQRGGDNEEGGIDIIDARRSVSPLGKQWAVFIAIDEYREWDPLQNPVKDAKNIKTALLDNYLIDETFELYDRDATRVAIINLFKELQDKTGLNDSVFVFHAGHGIDEERTGTSAWIPYDGGEDKTAQANWVRHTEVRSMLDSLRAKHVFLISDSCYSGVLLDQQRGGTTENIYNYPAAYDQVSRQAMSSGANENVSDVSEFASRLKNTLERTESPYLTPDYILSEIKYVSTMRELYTQPVLGPIPQSGHRVGGSFLFFRKNPRIADPIITDGSDKKTPEDNKDLLPWERDTHEYFVGSWTATVEHNMSFDTYEITLSANGRCTVKITNDIAQQETSGNWSWDGSMFRLSAVFRNPPITYQQNIQWVSIVSYGGGSNGFNILGRAATNGSPVRFVFFRNN